MRANRSEPSPAGTVPGEARSPTVWPAVFLSRVLRASAAGLAAHWGKHIRQLFRMELEEPYLCTEILLRITQKLHLISDQKTIRG